MNAETARLLAQALQQRNTAEQGLLSLLKRDDIVTPSPVSQAWTELATGYVHEQRIINRIIHEDTDEDPE